VAKWLLEHSADPNAYVAALGTLHMSTDGESFLLLVTPLLAAISTGSLPMIRLLVEYGATIDDVRNSGLTRTPLQRAAELGHFDIVKYFIDQHAIIDTEPAYFGGTALQLAAMNGHVGIARLLLENGADSNHLPAKGDGRTAFEAAIERGRVDTVLLLMRHGVDLDLRVGDPLETQYDRARRFAEKNGKFASKRMAERLYAQFQEHRRSAETSGSSSWIGTIEELWSPGPMTEPFW
jgi:ankyrin repeat protein